MEPDKIRNRIATLRNMRFMYAYGALPTGQKEAEERVQYLSTEINDLRDQLRRLLPVPTKENSR